MLKRTLLTALAAAATLTFAASAHAAYLNVGTNNPYSASTTLTGSIAAPALTVKNGNGSSASAYGLYGLLTNTAPSANAAAIRGLNSSMNGWGYGLWGQQNGAGTGVYGFTPSGKGVWGNTTSGTGVRGSSASGIGVYGQHTAPGSGGVGVYGTATDGFGVRGDSSYIGVYGVAGSTGIAGVEGDSANGYGVRGISTTSIGVQARSSSGDGLEADSTTGRGVFANVVGNGTAVVASSSSGIGLLGNTGSGTRGIIGTLAGTSCAGTYAVGGCGATVGDGVVGASTNGFGVLGNSSNSDGVHGVGATAGVAGSSGGGDGVYGETTSGYAGYFFGDVHVTGAITAGVKDFQIDDPLDPAHRYLQHSSVESSSMLDIYTGNVTTDARGYATVRLPGWFQAVNRSFRYQLTILGHAPWDTQARVWNEIAHNRFTIRTNHPGVRVSWQVTGVRHDPYANAYRTRVVVEKPKADQGKYLYPQLYGKPRSDAIGYRAPRPRRSR